MIAIDRGPTRPGNVRAVRHDRMCPLAVMVLLGCMLAVPTGCHRSGDGKDGTKGSGPKAMIPSEDTTLTDEEELPGINIAILDVDGADGDRFAVGDQLKVTFTVRRNDDSGLPITELDLFEAHISGPTFNYQRVIGETEVIRDGVIADDENLDYNSDGSYTYTFKGLPENYIDPPNESSVSSEPASYDGTFTAGVLSRTPLVGGTYTFVFIAYKNYTVRSSVVKDVANVAGDFLFGYAPGLEPRAVVSVENCNRCHDKLQWHTDGGRPGGGIVRDTRLCVTCHVSGAEDMNDPDVAGGTPDVTVDFRVMIHKIHNGAHLPSVLGIATLSTGARDMLAVPRPYQLVSDELEIEDFSGILFPVWPNFTMPMPKDYGYTLSGDPGTTPLAVYTPPVDGGAPGGNFGAGDTAAKFTSPAALNGRTWQQNDSSTRTGVTACVKCHGDPDGAGPLSAPAQGELAYLQLSRRACGSCHDDIDWTLPYRSNLKTMPAQPNDSECITCHVEGAGSTDDALWVENAHRHPLADPASWPAPYNDVGIDIVTLTPSDGATLDPGEKLSMTFTVKNSAGEDVAILPPGTPKIGPGIMWGGLPFGGGSGYPWPETQSTWWSSFSVAISGPTYNYNIVTTVDFPTDHPVFGSGSAGSYTMNVPEYLHLDDFGNGSGVGTKHGHAYGAGFLPIYNTPWVMTDVREATIDTVGGASSSSVAAAVAGQNYIDVAPSVPAFARGNYVRIDCGALPAAAGANREFLRVSDIEVISPTVTRIWFHTPYQTRGVMSSSTTGFGGLYGPWLRKSHASGVPVVQIDLAARALTTQYTIDPTATPYQGTGQITEVAGFGTGPILVTFLTDWVMKPYYPPAFFEGSDLGETWGDWMGKPTAPGTYSVNVWSGFPWAHKTDTTWPDWSGTLLKPWTGNIDYGYAYEVDAYRCATLPATTDFLVTNLALPAGLTPTAIEPYDNITSGDNCLVCHDEIRFHGSSTTRKNFETCIVCHGTAGLGIHQNYIAYPSGGNPPWPRGLENTANFRTFLHGAHRDALPTMPGGSRHCAKCHGEPADESDPGIWEIPGDRDHPTAQVLPVREWRGSCGGCHDSTEDLGHFELMTPSGVETCEQCHEVGAPYGAGRIHRTR